MYFRINKKNQLGLKENEKINTNLLNLETKMISKKDELLKIKQFNSIFKHWIKPFKTQSKSNFSILQNYNKWYLYSLFYNRNKILIFKGSRYKRRVRCKIQLKRLKWLNNKFLIAISSHKKSYKHKNFIFYLKIYKSLFKNNIKDYKKCHLFFLQFPTLKSFELSRQTLSYISVNSSIV